MASSIAGSEGENQQKILEEMKEEKQNSAKVTNEKKVPYICAQCLKTIQLNGKDIIRCHSCGYRIFYKISNEEGMLYEAK